MSANSQNSGASLRDVMNVPNQITSARILLSIVLFAFLAFEWYLIGFVLFIVAASTDWIDGYWARKYGQVTVLGRILDPFADKMIICGTFIFLAAVPESGVRAWMAVVIMGRELLVTALRSFPEERGSDFSASMAGKWKMVVQCIAVGFSLFCLSYLNTPDLAPADWMIHGRVVFVWAAIVLTVYSGVEYVFAAIRLMRK